MPEIIQSVDGSASVQYQLVAGKEKPLVFDAQRVMFSAAEITDSVFGLGSGLHTFHTSDPDFLESVKQIMSGANPVLEFRLGFGSAKQMYWLPWQNHIILNYHAKFQGVASTAGHLLVFNTANSFKRIERSSKVISRKGKISDMVKAIADDNKLTAVIEPTEGKYMLYQTFTDDISFVRERLLPRAMNSVGRGDFYFFIRDNVVHFHTPDYQSSVRQMNYYDVLGTELTVDDRSQDPALWNSGLAGTRIVAHDAFTAQTQEIKSDPNVSMRLADSIYKFSNVKDGQRNMVYHLSFNPPSEVSAIAQHEYLTARQQTFKSTVTVDKTISIRHGDILNLIITQQSDRASSHSGHYYVASSTHIVKTQSVTSVYNLCRGEISGKDLSFSNTNVNSQLVSDTEAPGKKPNFVELQSSELTKGAGKQSSAQIFTTISDANTGKPLV